MMEYIVHSGWVNSSDGDRHYIGAAETMRLYGLTRRDCLLVSRDSDFVGYSQKFLEQATHLYPDSSGKYGLPTPPTKPVPGRGV